MESAKYIKTEKNQIIVFSSIIMHSDFRNFYPVSAGFIRFSTNKDGEVTCKCYGESFSLGLGSDESDTMIARLQLGLSFND